MTQRERLIELLIDGNIDADESGTESRVERCEKVADWLIANGVVLPVRCCECEHCDIGQNDVEQWCICQVKRIDVDPTDFCSYGKRKGGD